MAISKTALKGFGLPEDGILTVDLNTGALPVDVASLPEKGLGYFILNGIRQSLNDANAAVGKYLDAKGEPCGKKEAAKGEDGKLLKRDHEEWLAEARKASLDRLKAIQEGTFSPKGATGPKADAGVRAFRVVLTDALRKRGVKVKDVPKIGSVADAKAVAASYGIPWEKVEAAALPVKVAFEAADAARSIEL